MEQFLPAISMGVLPGHEAGGAVSGTSVSSEHSEMEIPHSGLRDCNGNDGCNGMGRIPLETIQ